MVLLEAMALGVPVIAGRASGGTAWTLDDGRAGILVDVTLPDQVAGAMRDLTSSELRRAWGERGLELARGRFHIERVADAYEDVYARVLSGR
jgi:glycosyltransferase involved in cell wall biosynthesis